MFARRFVVIEHTNIGHYPRIGDTFGIFYRWKKAEKLRDKLQNHNPQNYYCIRELVLHGNHWLRPYRG